MNIANPPATRGFFRVVGLGASGSSGGPVTVEFSTVAFQALEGDSTSVTLVLNQPFEGVVFYSVSGTATSNDYQVLSGSVNVNGKTATIPITLKDDFLIGPLRELTLRLEAGPGYTLSGNSQATLTIDENDAYWDGTFVSGHAAIPFRIRVRRQAGRPVDGVMVTDRFGFFPDYGSPESITPLNLTFTPDTFTATDAAFVIPLEKSPFGLRIDQELDLSAVNGQPGQMVSSNRIEGIASLRTTFLVEKHLSTTNHGTFVLTKVPVSPSTNEVPLVAVP